jgi:hypothetical protein
VDGNAHKPNLPEGLQADLFVCAQALHTFRSDVLCQKASEALARLRWRPFLPEDPACRISIWYYNLDAANAAMIDLDRRLKLSSTTYANSKTPFLDAIFFEPSEFQEYISAEQMRVSNAQAVDRKTLSLESLKKWLRSFSFYPKNPEEEKQILRELEQWHEQHKNKQGMMELSYLGFITQGPLRLTAPFHDLLNKKIIPPASPITQKARKEKNSVQPGFWPEELAQKQQLRPRSRL